MAFFIFNRSTRDFVLSKVKTIDLYIILPVSFILFNYFLYIDERLDLQVLILYISLIYIYARSSITIYLRRDDIEDKTHLLNFTTILYIVLYSFRVLHILFIFRDNNSYSELKDSQTITVIFTFLLQILLTFIVSNLIYNRARGEIKKN